MGTPLFCEFLPPPVLLKELQSAILSGQLKPGLASGSPTLFWNLMLWFLSYNLPCDFLSYLVAAGEASSGASVGGN